MPLQLPQRSAGGLQHYGEVLHLTRRQSRLAADGVMIGVVLGMLRERTGRTLEVLIEHYLAPLFYERLLGRRTHEPFSLQPDQMKMMKRLLASMTLACCIDISTVQADTAWQTLTYSDPRHPSAFSPIVVPLWRRELADKPFYQIHAARFEAAGTTYLVSVAFAGGICDMRANGRNAVAEPAICPAQVDVLRGGAVVQTVRGRVCSVAPLPEDTTANPTDATEVQFDPASMTVSFRSRLSGKWVRACQRQIRVR